MQGTNATSYVGNPDIDDRPAFVREKTALGPQTRFASESKSWKLETKSGTQESRKGKLI
jgi:hypothetical protein